MRRRPARRRATASLPALVLALVLAGCGGDGSGGGDGGAGGAGGSGGDGQTVASEPTSASPTPAVLSQEQAQQALLTEADLGSGWVEQPNIVEEDDEPLPGCIGTVDNLSELGERSLKVRRQLAYEDEFPEVTSALQVWTEEATLVDVFDRVEAAVEDCPADEYTEAGTTFRISLVATTDLPVEGVDDQFGYLASGTITDDASGEEQPVHLHVNRFRIGPHMASVSTIAPQDQGPRHERYALRAAERLVTTLASATGPTASPTD